MSKIIDNHTFSPKTKNKLRIVPEEWFDGKCRLITIGEGKDLVSKNPSVLLQAQARRREKVGLCEWTDDTRTAVYFQAVTPVQGEKQSVGTRHPSAKPKGTAAKAKANKAKTEEA